MRRALYTLPWLIDSPGADYVELRAKTVSGDIELREV